MRVLSVVALAIVIAIGVGINLYSRDSIGYVVAQLSSIETENEVAFWTKVQAFSSIASLIGLFLTVLVAQSAWREAQRSATAAEEALTETRRLGAIANRAYLSMRKYEGKLTAGAQSVEFSFEIPNSGTTPALDVLIEFGGQICLVGDVNLVDWDDFEETTFYIVGGHHVSYAFDIPIPEEHRPSFIDGEVCVGVVVVLHYKDAFSGETERRLTCRMVASLLPGRKLWVRPCGSDTAV